MAFNLENNTHASEPHFRMRVAGLHKAVHWWKKVTGVWLTKQAF